MNEQVKLPVVELVYRRKPSKKYKIESARDAYELLVSPFKDTIEHHISTRIGFYTVYNSGENYFPSWSYIPILGIIHQLQFLKFTVI